MALIPVKKGKKDSADQRKTKARKTLKSKDDTKDSANINESINDNTLTGLEDYNTAMPDRQLTKPYDQLDLSEQEKNKEHTRILSATNPHAPDNIVRFQFKEAEYKQIPTVDQLAIHFSLTGNLIHCESDEARRQKQRAQRLLHMASKAAGTGGDSDNSEEDDDEPASRKSFAAPRLSVSATGGDQDKVLRNQFNFSERAAQTFNNPYRQRTVQTQEPARENFSASANQWTIYDAYQADLASQEREKEKATKKSHKKETGRNALLAKKQEALELERSLNQGDDLGKISRATKIIERMVNQNTFTDVADDFKYFNDEADEFRDAGKGTLLPLWKFNYEGTRKLAVTSQCWSHHYPDLFAVGYGSFNFAKQTTGALVLYSLKNPTHPEYVYETENGIMSVDFHPQVPNYVCVGFYNGNVAVFNLKSNSTEPEFSSSNNEESRKNKHTEPVWQVKWQPDNLDMLKNFCSIAGDGQIFNWVLVKTELMQQNLLTLKNIDSIQDLDDPVVNLGLASGSSFAFHDQQTNLFLAGTEEGKIFKCSQSYTSRYLDVIKGHHMTVEQIHWSPFHPDVFMTCSQDWSLKIWDHKFPKQPLFVYELGAAVGACCWAVHSSTVFAAVTNDGRVHVFDLSVNKYEALASQVITQKKKTKLSCVSFNTIEPILIVGDDRGHITTLKLSPNLRKIPKLKKGQVYKMDTEVECAKLEKIADLLRTK